MRWIAVEEVRLQQLSVWSCSCWASGLGDGQTRFSVVDEDARTTSQWSPAARRWCCRTTPPYRCCQTECLRSRCWRLSRSQKSVAPVQTGRWGQQRARGDVDAPAATDVYRLRWDKADLASYYGCSSVSELVLNTCDDAIAYCTNRRYSDIDCQLMVDSIYNDIGYAAIAQASHSYS